MELVIGVVGMVVLAGAYVALGLADRGGHGCGGCGFRGSPGDGCRSCVERKRP